jgi:hypothetical protein
MPCDSIQTSAIDLGKISDKALLMKALGELGYQARMVGAEIVFGSSVNGGTVRADGTVNLVGQATALSVNQIKRAYSTEAVKIASKKFGWNLQATGDRKFVAKKRY